MANRARTILAALLSILALPVCAQYFQQDVAYNIRVSLDDKQMFLHGEEEIAYTNNSPDTLTFIYMHLWPNAYQNKRTALAKQLVRMGETSMYFADEEDLGYIDSLDFKLNGKSCEWDLDETHIDIAKVKLNEPLLPGAQVAIHTPFRVKIPDGGISRLGHVGQSFQITQWYPKPAVYDQEGWHQMPYLTQGEFYSEFGSFDVFITLPANYVVGATGDLQTKSEVDWLVNKEATTRKWIDQREDASDWSEVSKDMDFPESSQDLKTLHFHQDRIHDFGWFADKRYHVLKGNVVLPGNVDSVDVWTMFTNKRARLWKNSIEYMEDAVFYYSLWNGNYPYRHATAVDGTISAGGGMEYPNVTVIGVAGDELTLETVIMHEVGHNWFYGILGSNERRYPWLDEGVNSYNEQRYLKTKYPAGTLLSKTNDGNKLFEFAGLDQYQINQQHYLTYLIMARTNRDQPMDVPAEKYAMLNYGFVVYSKSAATLNHLRHFLGDSTMDAGMHRYFEENKFKHPGPKDLESALESVSGENLDWFFNDVVTSREKIDYGIKRVHKHNDHLDVRLKNRGLRVPIPVSALDASGRVIETQWIDGFEGDTTLSFTIDAARIEIDHEQVVPEIIRDNNYSKTTGLLRRTEPVNLKFLGGLEDPKVNRLNYAPVLGMNMPNGLMPGLLLYNHSVPARKFSYFLMPMFTTKGQKVVGTGLLSYSVQPQNSILENIEITLSGKRYIYNRVSNENSIYHRIYPHVEFYLRPRNYEGMLSQQFGVGSVINTEYAAAPKTGVQVTTNQFNRIHYRIDYGHPVYHSKALVKAEHHSDFVRTSVTLSETMKFDSKFRIDARFFAGAFLANNTVSPIYNWRMDGQSAWNDYAYDGEFLDRNYKSDLVSRQFSENHGAFKVPTAVGQSSRWISALNLKAKLNKFPVGVFADIGVSESESFMYDAGLYFALIPNIVEAYLPLVYSPSIKNNLTANGLTWTDLIRFQIGIDKVNLFEKMKRLDVL